MYNVNEVNLKRNVKVNAQNKSVAEVLNKVFEGTDIYYAHSPSHCASDSRCV